MRFLLRSAIAVTPLLLAISVGAQAFGVKVATPDSNGAFGEQASARANVDQIQVQFDTYYPEISDNLDCALSYDFVAAPGETPISAIVGERVKAGETRPYFAAAAGISTVRLTHCRDANNTAWSQVEARAIIDVYPEDAVTVAGVCGVAANSPQTSVPNSSEQCATGTVEFNDASASDGVYNWSCIGSFGGETATCQAPVATSVGASFTGSRSNPLLFSKDTLIWSVPRAASCTASGAWSGNKQTAGSESFSYLLLPGKKTYTLTCTGPGGAYTKSLTLQ